MNKKYYTTAKSGEMVEVDADLARQLVSSGKKKPEDFQIEDVQPEKTLAESTLGLTKSLLPIPNVNVQSAPALGSSLSKSVTPFLPINKSAEIGRSAVESDKRVPAQNILPIIAGGAGGLIGGAMTSPSGAGIPFGATIGSGVFAGASKPIVNAISAMRGQTENLPETIPQSLGQSAMTGGEMAASELAGAGLLKGIELTGVGKLATKGFKSFKNKLLDVLTPAKGARDAAMEKLSSIPIKNVSKTEDIIKGIFEKHGIESPTAKLEQNPKFKDLVDRGVSEGDARLLLANDPTVEASVSKIQQGKMGKLSSKYETTKVKDFEDMGKTLEDLSNPENTYYDVYRIQNNIETKAGFDKPLNERTTIEKYYGKIYNSLNDVMNDNAKLAGLEGTHSIRSKEGAKYFQKKNLQSILDKSKTMIKGNEGVDWGKLAGQLKGMDDSQLMNEFGKDNLWMVKSLRDMSETNAKTFSQTITTPHMNINEGGAPTLFTRFNPLRILERANTGKYAENIVANYAPTPADVKPTAEMLYSRFPKTRRSVGVASKLPLPILREKQ